MVVLAPGELEDHFNFEDFEERKVEEEDVLDDGEFELQAGQAQNTMKRAVANQKADMANINSTAGIPSLDDIMARIAKAAEDKAAKGNLSSDDEDDGAQKAGDDDDDDDAAGSSSGDDEEVRHAQKTRALLSGRTMVEKGKTDTKPATKPASKPATKPGKSGTRPATTARPPSRSTSAAAQPAAAAHSATATHSAAAALAANQRLDATRLVADAAAATTNAKRGRPRAIVDISSKGSDKAGAISRELEALKSDIDELVRFDDSFNISVPEEFKEFKVKGNSNLKEILLPLSSKLQKQRKQIDKLYLAGLKSESIDEADATEAELSDLVQGVIKMTKYMVGSESLLKDEVDNLFDHLHSSFPNKLGFTYVHKHLRITSSHHFQFDQHDEYASTLRQDSKHVKAIYFV
jgi:hypothetical protein